jgi:hypothetical protein
MGWRDLLQTGGEHRVLPWVGGRALPARDRRFVLEGDLPAEHGWYRFATSGRKARIAGEAPADEGLLCDRVTGYLAGDRLVPDAVRIGPDLGELARRTEPVFLVERGLERFARVTVGRAGTGSPLVFLGLAFPLGPEDEVLAAFLDDRDDLDHIRGVPPALDAVYRLERWRRADSLRRRREAEERRRHERWRRAVIERLGDGALRRAVAAYDFVEAASAALAVGGAVLVDARPAYHGGEMVVRFRLDGRPFECTCEADTLRIVDAGICLVDHHTGERGDTRFTLESLPGVIAQASREGVLVAFRVAHD